MKAESNIDKSTITSGVPRQEEGRIITTYEKYESKFIRKSVCDCKYFANKGAVAECRLYDDDEKEIGRMTLPNSEVWHCFANRQPIAVADEDKYLIFPGMYKGAAACFEIKTNKQLWSWPANEFFYIYVKGREIYTEWCYTGKGGLTVLDVQSGEILRQVMTYNTKMHHPYINRLNEKYMFIYSQGGVFLLDMDTDKIYMSKAIFREFMTQDAEFVTLSHIEINNENLMLEFYNHGYIRVYSTDPLGWETKEIKVSINEIMEGMQESTMGIKIPTSNVGIERLHKKLFRVEN